ncbi:translocation/assembly module TamB domain-containing protein [Pseudoalteromonas sp. MMG013]|uniref:translocation/assembly module TamB domain-containing protein n=1 Tax=Pseudoalteromonas sp. MMG013 TaxID=2822687 RepID=UPI001B39CA42|nr:translocation/assembly module TamB domain-containing protein [Pseudoalteromonas sp. MMG013]MBQ4861729.1 translocation/assembly module TamB domain-containing protein [Pseudoalteromonas sp. MMG013]
MLNKFKKYRFSYTCAVLIVIVVSIFFTVPGNHLLLASVSKLVPGLEVSVVNRRIFSGGDINIDYQTQQFDFEGKNVNIELSWFSCATVCVSVVAQQLDMTLHNQKLSGTENKSTRESINVEAREQISAPVDIVLELLSIKKLSVTTPEAKVLLTDTHLVADWINNTLKVHVLHLNNVSAILPEQSAPRDEPKMTALPVFKVFELFIPMAVKITQLNIDNVVIEKSSQQHVLSDIALSGKLHGTAVLLRDMTLAYQQFVLRSNINLDTEEQWNISSFTTLTSPHGLLSLQTNGSLNDLNIGVTTQGGVASKVNSQVDMTTLNWPFKINGVIEQQSDFITPLELVGDVSAGRIYLAGTGNAQQYVIDLNGKASASLLGSIESKVQLTGSMGHIDISEAQLQIEQAQANVSAKVQWHNELMIDIRGSLKALPLGVFIDDINTQLSGEFKTQIMQKNNAWELFVQQLSLTGIVQEKALKADIKLKVNEHGYGSIDELSLRYGKSVFNLQGTLAEQVELDGLFNLDHTRDKLLPVDAVMHGTLRVLGTHKSPHIFLNSDATRISHQQFELNNANIFGEINLAQQWQGAIKVSVAELVTEEEKFDNIALTVDGNRQKHTLTVHSQGSIQTDIELNGSLKSARWEAELATAELNYQGLPIMLAEPTGIVLSTEASFVMPHCWVIKQSKVCMQAKQEGHGNRSGRAALSFSQFQLADLNSLVGEWALTGQANGMLEVNWQADELHRADGKLAVKNMQLITPSGEYHTQLPIELLHASLHSDKHQVALDWHIDSSLFGQLLGDITMATTDRSSTRAKLKIKELQLTPFTPLLSQIMMQPVSLSGAMTGNVTLLGSLDNPKMGGEIRLSEFEMASPMSPVALHQSSLVISLAEHQANLAGQLNAVHGGHLDISGNLEWYEAFAADISATGKEFLISPQPGIEVSLSPLLNVNFANRKAHVKGELVLPYGRVEVAQLPKGVIKTSEDQYIVGDQREQENLVPFDYDLDVTVKVLDDFRVVALGLDSYISGEIMLTKEPASPLLATGEMELQEGKYRAFGQDLLIETGQIGFNGALDKPYLNISAIRNPEVTADRVKAGVELTGNINNPTLTIFSEPSMDQAKALEYLLNGEPLGSGESSNSAMLTQFLLSKSIDRSEGFVAKTGKKLGFEDVSLTAKGSGDDTQVEVSGYIAPNVQVSYRVGVFDSLSEIAVRYRVFSKMYIEATSGLYDSIDLLYKFDRGE